MILPTWCDSHTHIVFAGSREGEFVDRINGLSYEEIAERGGGILNSAARMATATETELINAAQKRLNEVIGLGTGAIEIKSGYGLSVESELKMLRVIRALTDQNEIPIKATFLGAHAYPLAYRENKQAYIDLIINEMLPQIESEKLADYIDVFCEEGFFSPEQSRTILEAGIKHGLRPRVHAHQMNFSDGIKVGVELNAISVDHLECFGEAEIELLKGSETMPTLLPGAAFFLRQEQAPARKMIDAGLPVALATDYNRSLRRAGITSNDQSGLCANAYDTRGGHQCSYNKYSLCYGCFAFTWKYYERKKSKFNFAKRNAFFGFFALCLRK
ncbi:UNVERIFIED_CONTAM: hypothetical protein GTU68_031775 [Idotea baltica]|nr:hypothetical protein [Idotea baltica]